MHHEAPPPWDAEFNREFRELERVIQSLPLEDQACFRSILERLQDALRRVNDVLAFMEESKEQLRLDMKCVLFDLYATGQERDDYRRRLEEET